MLDGHVLEKMCRQLCLTACIYIGCGYGVLDGCIPEKALYAVLDGIRPLQLLFAGARQTMSGRDWRPPEMRRVLAVKGWARPRRWEDAWVVQDGNGPYNPWRDGA